jgi:hypothetical protein
VTQSEATGRFSDACALMISAKPLTGNLNPSLQMGDAAHPVRIYFWDATRGPAILEATGRETTKRTGQVFPALGQYAAGSRKVDRLRRFVLLQAEVLQSEQAPYV